MVHKSSRKKSGFNFEIKFSPTIRKGLIYDISVKEKGIPVRVLRTLLRVQDKVSPTDGSSTSYKIGEIAI